MAVCNLQKDIFMGNFEFNLLMAAVIAVVITVISVIKNSVVKAIVYGLPIPITVALIASQRGVDGTHVAGLFLLVGFIWSVYWLCRSGLKVITADVLSALLYVGIGYVTTKLPLGGEFVTMTVIYVCFWLIYMKMKGENHVYGEASYQPKKVSLVVKSVSTFGIASLLLMLKELLSGVIVTFPFSGVFAVLEMHGKLQTLATEFTKNSIAILTFFVAVYIFTSMTGLYTAIIIGWIIYFVILKAVQKYC